MGRTAKKDDATQTRFVVAQRFKDSAKYAEDAKKPNYYNVGEDVSDFDADRLKDLVSRGLVTDAGEPDAE